MSKVVWLKNRIVSKKRKEGTLQSVEKRRKAAADESKKEQRGALTQNNSLLEQEQHLLEFNLERVLHEAKVLEQALVECFSLWCQVISLSLSRSLSLSHSHTHTHTHWFRPIWTWSRKGPQFPGDESKKRELEGREDLGERLSRGGPNKCPNLHGFWERSPRVGRGGLGIIQSL